MTNLEKLAEEIPGVSYDDNYDLPELNILVFGDGGAESICVSDFSQTLKRPNFDIQVTVDTPEKVELFLKKILEMQAELE